MVLVKIDEHGRLVIPAEIRKKLGLEGTVVEIKVLGNEVLIRKVEKVDEKEIEEWLKDLEKISPKVEERIEKIKEKWMSEEYGWKKIGWYS